jgi:hypothetical protein
MRAMLAACMLAFFAAVAVAQTTISGSNSYTLDAVLYSDTACATEYNRTSESIGQCEATALGDSYFAARSFCNSSHYVTGVYTTQDCSGTASTEIAFPLSTCVNLGSSSAQITCSGAAAVSALFAVVAVIATLVL